MQAPPFNPTNNHMNVSQMRSPGFYANFGKQFLEKFPTVELHAIGNAMSVAIKAADLLTRYSPTTSIDWAIPSRSGFSLK